MNRFQEVTVQQIASWLGLSEAETWYFARNLDSRFFPTREIETGGKIRVIDAPRPSTKKRLRRLHKALQRRRLFHGAAHGAVVKKSIFTSARPHCGSQFIWTRDAKDCFPSIDHKAMRSELRSLGFRTEVAKLLSSLFVIRGRVPQGSPLSNDALNLYFYRLDQFAASRAGQIGFSFTRVVDDFVVSGYEKSLGDPLIRKLESHFELRNLQVNQKKRRANGFQDVSGPQHVHNLQVNTPRKVKVGKAIRHRAVGLAERYTTMTKRVDACSLPAIADVRQRLVGYFNFLNQADSSPVKYLKDQLGKGDRAVRRKLHSVGLSSRGGKWWVIVRQGKRRRNEPLRLSMAWKRRLAAKRNPESVDSPEQPAAKPTVPSKVAVLPEPARC